MSALLHHKLELAIVAWLEANRGDLFPGVNIVASHTNAQQTFPEMVVRCQRAQMHPDFDGCGRRFPMMVPTGFSVAVNSEDVESHGASIGQWIAALDELLQTPAEDGGAEYSALIASLNPPASGPETRPQKDLYVYAIHPGEDEDGVDGLVWGDMMGLEIIAQNGDPS